MEIYGALKAGNNTSNQVPEIITGGSAQCNVTNSLGHIWWNWVKGVNENGSRVHLRP